MEEKKLLSEFIFDQNTGVHIPPAVNAAELMAQFKYADWSESYIEKSLDLSNDVSYDSDELMNKVRDWPSYYHLGIGRANHLRALRLNNNAKVLEVGSGCGAITRYLAEKFTAVDALEGSFLRAKITRKRCRGLNNVRVFCANIDAVSCIGSYDIIIMNGVLEYAPLYIKGDSPRNSCKQLLNIVKESLKQQGVVITSIENQIGFKYFSGCVEDHTGKVYDGIHGYPEENTPVTFSRKELVALFQEGGFLHSDFYYCFPDYKFAATILTDNGDSQEYFLHNWIETPFPHFHFQRKHSFNEPLVLRTLSQAGLLKDFANSFIVVSRKIDSNEYYVPPNWIASCFSLTSRRKELRCRTTLYNEPKLFIKKERLNGNPDALTLRYSDTVLHHKIGESKWIAGELMSFEVYEALFKKNYKKYLIQILTNYVDELKRKFSTDKTDKEGFDLLTGNSIDYILANLIKSDTRLTGIDDEWRLEENVPIDFILCRSLIISLRKQGYWLKNKVLCLLWLEFMLIRALMPQYSLKRHFFNLLREKKFQKVVRGNITKPPLKMGIVKIVMYKFRVLCSMLLRKK